MKKLIVILGKIDAALMAIMKWLTIAFFLALTLIITANVLLRIFPFTSLHWTDELVALGFAVILFTYALSLALRARETTAVFQIPKRILYSCMPVSSLIMIAYSLAFVIKGAIGTISPKALAGPEPEK